MTETLSAVISAARHRREQPALYVGLVADAPRAPASRISLAALDRVELGRSDARRLTLRREDDAACAVLELADGRLSQRHARLTRVGGVWVLEDLRSKNGSWIDGERITSRQLCDGDAILVGHTMLVFRTGGGEEPTALEPAAPRAPGLGTLAPVLAARFGELATAARTTVPIEIVGETGTGKELAARAAHTLSGRPGRFVAVNCGALAQTLLEAELFGHHKGAYTGAADDRAGLVRSADRGTLFLDEVVELAPVSQVALLRVLQEGEVVPVGADRGVKVDVRVVVASHRGLDAAVAAGTFRADLRARLLGVAIELPPLRDRIEDLGLLVPGLLAKVVGDREITFSADAVAALYAHDWPLNIRELERSLAAAAAVAPDRIELGHLPATMRTAGKVAAPVDVEQLSPADRTRRAELEAAIARHGGNLAEVAREMGKDRTQIRRWMKRFGLTR